MIPEYFRAYSHAHDRAYFKDLMAIIVEEGFTCRILLSRNIGRL